MDFQSLRSNRLVLVVDQELSSYKGVKRICQQQNIEVIHVDSQSALINWHKLNHARTDSSAVACCIVFDPALIDVFDHKALSNSLTVYPKISISRSDSAEALLQSSRNGLFEFLAKPFRLDAMQATLERAFVYFEQTSSIHNRFLTLTKRELETCGLLSEGCSNKDIADRLGISIKTVKVHRANLMRKIDVKSIADLLRAYNAFHSLSNNVVLTITNSSADTSQ